MMLLFPLFVLALCVLLLFRRSALPPGPIGLPLIGCIPYINPSTAHLTLERWCRKYGGVISFYLGQSTVVVLGDCESIRTAFIKTGDVFNGRNVIRTFRTKGAEGIGLTGAEGDLWREQRRFCIKSLRDFGAGRSILEDKITREAKYVCDEITKQEGRPFNPKLCLHYAVANIIVQFVFGCRFDYDDPAYIDYLSLITYRLSLSGVNGFSWFNFLPWILKLPGQSNAKKVIADGSRLLDFLKRCIDEKKRKLEKCKDNSLPPSDYISAFVKAAMTGDGEYFHDDQLLIAVQQLFIAGSETSTTTLLWALWHLCMHPDCQDRIYQEINCVSGGDHVSWSDRLSTPYTEAAICEVERICTVFPFSVTHRTLDETRLGEYYIPKDAYVVPLLWAVHMDPTYFPEPDKFRPERFLDSEGKLAKNPSFMPFGVGPRVCLGESLARMEIYLFLTSLLQRFRFQFATNTCEKSTQRVVGAVISPAPFEIIAQER